MARKIDVSLISGNGGSNGQLLGANTGNVSFQSVFTGNVIESGNTTSGNVYFSNARAIGALIAGDNISIAANGRISANLSAVSVSSVTGNLNVSGNVIANGFVSTSASAGLISSTGNITMTAAGAVNINSTNVIASGNVIANTFISTGAGSGLLSSTGNVSISASGVVTLTGSSIVVNGPLTANSYSGIFTANVTESASNLYFTNARVYANVVSLLAAKANVSDLSTSNIAEGNNLYYTNARVASNVIALMPSLQGNNIIIAANGQISANLTGVSVNVNNITGNLNVTGNVIANGFVSTSASAGIITSTGNITITAAGAVNINSTNVIASGNIIANTFISAGAGSATLSSTGNVSITGVGNITLNTGNVIASGNVIANKFFGDGSSLTGVGASSFSGNTNGITEGTNNLFYTNTRVVSNTLALLPTLAGSGISIAANGQISSAWQNTSTTSNVTFGALNVTGPTNFYGNVTTYSSNNLSISDNMIYLNSASQSSNPDLGFAGNYNDGTYRHTGFFRDASDGNWKVFDSYTPEPDANIFIDTAHASFRLANIQANTFVGTTGVFSGNITAGNVIANTIISPTATAATITSTGNLNITALGAINLTSPNVIASGNIVANNIITGSGSGGSFTGANLISAGNISATTWLNLYTANVIESGNSIFYTNARVLSNVTAYLAANPQTSTYGNANVGAFLTTYTGNIAGGNLVLTGGIIDNVGVLSISTTSNSNIELSAAGNGRILLDGQAWPHTDGVNGYVLQTNGTGNLFWAAAASSFANANVVAFLTTYTGNITAGNVIANTIISPTATAATITSTGNLNITAAGAINLTTPNVLVSGNVVANNFISTGSGSGEVASTSNLLLSAAGNLNLTSSNVFVNGNLVLRGGLTGLTLTTSSIAEGSNLYYTNARVLSNIVAALPTYTGNIAAGNLILTGGIIDNVGVLSISTTGNSNIELVANGTGRILLDGQAWPHTDGLTGYILQTNGTGNLFWAAPTASSSFSNANVGAYLTTYTGNISAGNIISNSFVSPSATSATLTSTGNLNIIAAGTINLTTPNVLVSGNIVANNFISAGAGAGEIVSTSNLLLSAAGNLNLTSSNVFVNGNLVLRGGLTGLTLTTSSIAEGSNLYYTNARVVSNVIAYLAANPVASAGNFGNANVGAFLTTYTGNITAGNVTVGAGIGGSLINANLISAGNVTAITTFTGNITGQSATFTGNIAAGNLILTGAITDSVGVLSITTTGNSNIELFAAGNGRILLDGMAFPATDGLAGYSLQTNGTGNLFWGVSAGSFSNANVGAFLTTYTGNISAGNVIANTVISPSATSGTLNSTGNLNIIAQNNTINLTASNVLASGNIIANTFIATGTGSAELSTSSNLLLSATGNLNLSGGNIFVNSPITFRGTVTGIASASVTQANLTTANVAELASSGNLYYTNARVYSNVLAALPTYTGNIAAGNLILTGGIVDNVGVLTITTTGNSNIELVANGTGRILLDGQAWPHTDGVNGYVLQTNGTGNLFWSAPAASFGNANVGAYLTTYTGNISAGNVIANALVGNAIIGTGNGPGGINSTGNLVIYSTGTIIAQSPFRFSGYANVNILANTSIGDTVYNTAANALVVYTSSGWTTVGSGGGGAAAAVGYSLIFGG